MSFDSQAGYSDQHQSVEGSPSDRFMDDQFECDDDYDTLQPDLDLRMQSLLDALDHLAV